MFTSAALPLLVAITGLLHGDLGAVAARITARDGTTPALAHDLNTGPCSYWVDVYSDTDCLTLLDANFITLTEFRRLVRIMKQKARNRCTC